MEREDYIIPNMDCEGCKKSIEQTLKGLGGVTDVEIDLPTRTVTVFHVAQTSAERIRSALDETGYVIRQGRTV